MYIVHSVSNEGGEDSNIWKALTGHSILKRCEQNVLEMWGKRKIYVTLLLYGY